MGKAQIEISPQTIRQATHYQILETVEGKYRLTPRFSEVFWQVFFEEVKEFLEHPHNLQKRQKIEDLVGDVSIMAVVTHLKVIDQQELLDLAHLIQCMAWETILSVVEDLKKLQDRG